MIFVYRDRLEEMKTIQKLRQRPNGVNIAGLALGEKITADLTVMLTQLFERVGIRISPRL